MTNAHTTLKTDGFQRFTTPQIKRIAQESRKRAIRSAFRFMFSKNPTAKDTLDI